MEGFSNVTLLDRAIVLADFGQSSFSRTVDFVSFIRLDRFVMDPALVLRHQDIILLPLLLRLYLRIQRVYVLLLHFLLLHLSFAVKVVHITDPVRRLVGEQLVVLAI